MGIIQRDSFRVTAISYAGAVLGYLNKIFLFTNFLDVEQVGLANLMVTIALIYAQVSALGSRNIITRFFPFFHDGEKNNHGFLFGMISLAMAGFVITTLLFIALQKPFAILYKESSPLLVEYALYIIPLGLASMFYNLFESYLRSLYRNVVPTLAHEVILRLLVTVAITLYALKVLSFPGFVAFYVVAYCVPAVLLIIYTGYQGLLAVRPAYSRMLRRLGRIMLVYGLFTLANNLSTFLLVSVDSLMVAGMIDLGAAGIYTTMVFMTSVMLIPYRSMVKVAGPMVARFWKTRNMDGMEEVYQKATAGNLVVGGVLFLLIWVNLDTIFAFMAPEYKAGRYIFLLLGIGKLFDMSAGLNATILMTSKKFRYDLYFTIVMVCFALVANLAFIPRWGSEGAALASMLTLVLFNMIRIAFIQYHYQIQPFARKQVWVPVIMASVMVLSEQIAPFAHVLIELPLRSAIAAFLLLLPVRALRISPELNLWSEEMIKRARRLFKPEHNKKP